MDELMLAKHRPECFAVMFIGVPIDEDGNIDYAAWEKFCNCGATSQRYLPAEDSPEDGA